MSSLMCENGSKLYCVPVPPGSWQKNPGPEAPDRTWYREYDQFVDARTQVGDGPGLAQDSAQAPGTESHPYKQKRRDREVYAGERPGQGNPFAVRRCARVVCPPTSWRSRCK